jgi:cardiolipin synthase
MSSAVPTRGAKAAATPLRLPTPNLYHLLNIPNFLTLCRLISIPFFLVLLSKHRFTYALYLFAAAAITDSLDGTVARWFNSKTELGAFLDPFADKLLLVSSFVVLTIERVFPSWLLTVVVMRDVTIVFGYVMVTFLTGERIPVRPSYLGKASTFLQLACIVAALFGGAGMGLSQRSWYGLMYLTIATTGLSGLQYIYRGLVILNYREPEMFS